VFARIGSRPVRKSGELLLSGILALGMGIATAAPLAASDLAQGIPGSFVGTVSDLTNNVLEPLIGIVTDGTAVMAYICGGCIGGYPQHLTPGDDTEWWPDVECPGLTHSDWFRGQISGNAVELTGMSGAKLVIAFVGAGPSGVFQTADGRLLPFTTEPAAGDAGLYRSVETHGNAEFLVGAVALNDGDVRGIVQCTGACPTPRSTTATGTIINAIIGLDRPGSIPLSNSFARNQLNVTGLGSFNPSRVITPQVR
jgi:hypothetical protein